MTYVVFARKYRPRNFGQIVGQGHITRTLKNAIEQDRTAHAYLFSGPRGIGKTTTARILAKALNCENRPGPDPCNKCISCKEIDSGASMDVIEIDGASNRGIDEVRELRENVKFAPVHGRYKLYIIDEVHMLTPEAFNALLKTLEEPPPHVKFIFATTQPQKVPATVTSRCQRFDFKRISARETVLRLKEIAAKESIDIDEEPLFSIARQAEGSLRDAESILDQLNTFCKGKIRADDIAQALGTASEGLLEEFIEIVIKRDAPGALMFINSLIGEGKDINFFLQSLIEYLRDLMVAKLSLRPEDLIFSSRERIERLARQARAFSQEELFYISNILTNTYESARRSSSGRVIFELAVIKIIMRQSIIPLNELLRKIQEIEKRVGREGLANLNTVKSSGTAVLKSRGNEAGTSYFPGRHNNGFNKTEKNSNGAADIELSKINEAWPTFIKVIKAKKMSAASYLLEGSPVSFSDGILTVCFPKNYTLHKEALENKGNKMLIEEALKNIFDRSIRVNLITQDTSKEEAAGCRSGDKQEGEGIESEILKESVVQSAIEIFDGRIIRKKGR